MNNNDLNTVFGNTADSIREKLRTQDKIKPEGFAESILNIDPPSFETVGNTLEDFIRTVQNKLIERAPEGIDISPSKYTHIQVWSSGNLGKNWKDEEFFMQDMTLSPAYFAFTNNSGEDYYLISPEQGFIELKDGSTIEPTVVELYVYSDDDIKYNLIPASEVNVDKYKVISTYKDKSTYFYASIFHSDDVTNLVMSIDTDEMASYGYSNIENLFLCYYQSSQWNQGKLISYFGDTNFTTYYNPNSGIQYIGSTDVYDYQNEFNFITGLMLNTRESNLYITDIVYNLDVKQWSDQDEDYTLDVELPYKLMNIVVSPDFPSNLDLKSVYDPNGSLLYTVLRTKDDSPLGTVTAYYNITDGTENIGNYFDTTTDSNVLTQCDDISQFNLDITKEWTLNVS